MPVSLPTPDQLKRIAEKMNLSLTDADIASFVALMKPSIDGYNVVDQLPDNLPPVKYPRTPGYRPQPEENPHNAWYYKSRIEGAAQGKLKGKTVVIKDNVMVAGVPMMNGASTLEGYMPEVDATVVTRILDAGGTILGKAHCEYYCLSGGSHTNATGPVTALSLAISSKTRDIRSAALSSFSSAFRHSASLISSTQGIPLRADMIWAVLALRTNGL